MKFSNVSSQNTYQYFQVLPEEDVLDKDISNDFSYLESILAAYLLYDFHFGEKWNTNVGLRAEYTHSDAHLMPVAGSTNEESHVRRDYVDLFPSAGVTFKPGREAKLVVELREAHRPPGLFGFEPDRAGS